jgi:hypothetical protein
VSYESGDNYLDGEKIADWFKALFPEGQMPDDLAHRCSDWRRKGRAPLETVDHYLVRLGYHPRDLADELWIPEHRFCERCGEDIGLHSPLARVCAPCRKAVQRKRWKRRRQAREAVSA